jgi:hypothetical protein
LINNLMKAFGEIYSDPYRVFWIVVTGIISGFVGYVIKDLILVPLTKYTKVVGLKLFQFAWKLLKKLYFAPVYAVKRRRERKKYMKTIKYIEQGKIEVTDSFLSGKSPEKNPELKKIYEMLEEGIIKAPKFYELYKKLSGKTVDEILANAKNNLPLHHIRPTMPPFLQDNEIFKKK